MSKSKLHCGLTLIELLAALTLSTLLMIAVSGILGLLSVQQRQEFAKHPTRNWQHQLAEQLRWEIYNSRRYELSPGKLKLTGYAGRGFSNQRATLRPTEILYTIVEDESGSRLVRKETHLDGRTNHNQLLEVACWGVSSLQFQIGDQNAQQTRHQGAIDASATLSLYGAPDTPPILFITVQMP